ncbi:hypothetical protein BLA29_013970, partial [Euroglyphus maynei]
MVIRLSLKLSSEMKKMMFLVVMVVVAAAVYHQVLTMLVLKMNDKIVIQVKWFLAVRTMAWMVFVHLQHIVMHNTVILMIINRIFVNMLELVRMII